MSKYPKKIGAVLWLHFNLLMNVDNKGGEVTTNIVRLNKESLIPKHLIKSTLQKLIDYGLIQIKPINAKKFIIKLNYYGH